MISPSKVRMTVIRVHVMNMEGIMYRTAFTIRKISPDRMRFVTCSPTRGNMWLKWACTLDQTELQIDSSAVNMSFKSTDKSTFM